MNRWFIIGVSGVTCGGKSTLAKLLHETLPGSILIQQDDFFLPEDSEKHILIPEINHLNWEIMSSLDMDKMWDTIQGIVNELEPKSTCSSICMINANAVDFSQPKIDLKSHQKENFELKSSIPIIIVEGFLILNYSPIIEICNMKYFLTLNREQCWERRRVREYIPADPPGYFDMCVWPTYQKHRDEMLRDARDVIELDGSLPMDVTFDKVLRQVQTALIEFCEVHKNPCSS